MVPSKSTRKSSRRSSILKPPKPRQPLQNLNSSSKESSPATTKIKRRVSFAEKKHVKEFCNSLEQGTVWDNTYEEHDLSNIKISTKNQEEHQVANFCKETIYSSTQENNVQFTCYKESEKNLNIEDCSQNINLNKHVKCQNEMLLCTPLSVTFNDGSPQKDCIVQKFQQFNKPNVAMVEVRNEDTSMELTVAVPSVIQPVDNVETATCFVDDRTQRFDNISMEITAAVPNALYLLQSNINKINHISNLVANDNDNDNKIIIFNDVSMDITELVEKRVHKSSNRTTVMQDILQHKCDTANQDEETKLLNVSMEMTEMIPVNVHSVTRSFETNGLNYDTAKNNSKKLRYDTDAYETSVNHDETRIFNDEEMELTTAITASSEVLQTDPRIPVENTPYLQSKLDRTKICNNEEMEFTTAITASSEVLQPDSQVPVENTAYLQSKLDRTKICNNEEMEFTTAITASSEVLQPDSQVPVENTPYLQSKLDRTKICNNEEMEFTTAITASSEVLQTDSQIPVENTPYLQSKLDRTKICNNEEMEFTTAITASSEVLQTDSRIPVENTPYLQSKLDRTKICNNEEMEFTTAITASSEVLQPDSQVPVENTPYLQSKLDRTKICNNEEMEFTTAITASSEVLQTDSQIPVENTPYLQSKLDRTKICNNEEMEFTTAITASSEVLQTDSRIPVENTPYLQSKLDRTKICNNEEMEFTTAITASSEVLQPDSQVPVENTAYLQSKLDRTEICNNEEMEFTTAITASSEVLQPDSQVPVENTGYLQSKLDRTKICNNEEIEFTTAITASSEVLQTDSRIPVENTPYLQSKLDRTKTCYNEEMEFTTAITASSEGLQIDSQVPVENTPYLQPNLANSVLEIYRNGSANSISNRTTIFCNNSMTMTKVVSLLNTEDVMIDNASDKNNQESSKAMLFPNTSTEVTEAVVTSQPHSQTDDPIANSTKFRQSILSKSCENKDLVTNSSTYADKILKDSSVAISPSLNFDKISGKENYTVTNSTKNIGNSLIEESTPVEVQSSASIKPSMALHELMQQHTCVSALKENNTEKAYVVFNSASNDSFSAVNSEINKTECLQNATSSSRRTYIIQPLNNDQTLTISNKENNKISEMNHETLFCTLNDKESSICNISNNPSNVQTGEDCDEEHVMEKYVTFHNEDLEDIDLIEPPMFVCLDDISSASTSMSVTCNQEVDMEMNCLSKNENTKSEDSSKFDVNYSNHNLEQDSEENVRKSDIFVIKCSRPNEQLEKSKLEQEDQEQTNKIQKFKLPDVRDTNTKIQVLECSSSIICDNEKLITSNGEKDPKDLCRDNSNLENQNMECSLSNIIPIYESTPKVDTENNDKLINIHVMEIDNQFYSNEQIKSTLEFDAACTEEHISNELDPFSSLMNELRVCTKSDDIIWELYHENIERNVFVIGFISCSLLVIIYVRDICDVTGDRYIKEVKVTSRLADNAGELIGIIHRIILEKVDVKQLLNLYKSREDILPMLDHIAKEVKLAMDFMFDVKRLNNINLMEITRDSISFVSRTKRMDIILKITICIKPFDRIESQDISVHCILGSVREEDVKMLITNIKKDHKFLRKYMNDVKDYIYLMEDCGGVIEKSN